MAKYKILSVRKISLDSLAPEKKPKRELSPRQKAAMERDEEIRAALNEAATMPASDAMVIELREGQKVATMRLAVNKVLAAEKRDLNFAVRGSMLIFSKGEIPGGRGRKRKAG